MYPYYYPTYFNPQMPMGKGNATAATQTTPPMPEIPEIPETPMTPGAALIGPAVPGTTSGTPAGPVAPPPPTIQPPQVNFEQQPGPPVTTDIGYTQAFLKTQIGRKARIEFLIGTNSLTDRIGTLVGVGISYILLRLEETDDIMLGDMYSIKFVTFYH
jgi:hypothetical protein